MTTVTREKIFYGDVVHHVIDLETEIKIKREWGERFEREEQSSRGSEQTAYEEVQGERCGLSVKASKEKTELEEEVTLVLAGMKETNAEMEVDLLREGRDDDDDGSGGGEEEEGTEGEVVAGPAANAPAKSRDRSSGKKRKAATLVEEQHRDVKKEKRASPKGHWNGRGFSWTADEDTALVEGVDEHGLEWDRIKADAGARLGDRTVSALENHFRECHPETFRELMKLNPSGGRGLSWTAEEDKALKSGMAKHGTDWEKIHETEKDVLGHRKVVSLKKRIQNLKHGYSKNKHNIL
ncbi:hypothetical protein TL16_g09088 [Triparma laevis f. inornata]|uniref:Myb-like domain-containing protein n=1 Tax=Triparma laevis f. inornata TaxID=1714386 RepID=A0A9W7B4F8_9STRA|nr:hypothetical protein TL16_g09088 [Triparma laevis f. inornata]